MNILKMLSGVWFLVWILFSSFVTFPIWVLIFAYDLGNPRDDKDRVTTFFEKMASIGGAKIPG